MNQFHSFFVALYCSFFLFTGSSNAQEWNFNTSLDGWMLTNGLNGTVNSGILNLSVTANDPYMHSPNNLGLSASTYKTIKINCKNTTNQTKYQLYFITNADGNWGTNGKLINIDVDANSSVFKEYIFDLSAVSAWQGTIKQLRLDPGNPATGSTLAIDYIKLTADSYQLTIDNSILKLKVDLLKGGAISYLSKSADNYNLVNTYDKGRYIQQSYYAGTAINRLAEGQHPSWSPWNWNPVQAGDAYNHSSVVIASSQTDSTIYVKTQPLLWDMNNELAQAYMEMWISLRGSTVHVANKLTCFRTDNKWVDIARHQELPAVYVIGDLYKLYTYKGTSPWTSAPIDTIINAGPPWRYFTSLEKWAAFVNNSNWGLGVYNSGSTYFVGGFNGSIGGTTTTSSTGYMSPLRTETLTKNSVYQYEYDLIVGSLDEIRSFVYTANNKVLPVNITYLSAERRNNRTVLSWKADDVNDLHFFQIEKSDDAINFKTVAVVYPVQHQLAYNYTDEEKQAGKCFYRIKVTEKNGKTFYTNVVSIKSDITLNAAVAGIDKNSIKINFSAAFSGNIVLMDITGKKHSSQKYLQQNSVYYHLPFPIATGCYFLVLSSEKHEQQTIKVIIP